MIICPTFCSIVISLIISLAKFEWSGSLQSFESDQSTSGKIKEVNKTKKNNFFTIRLSKSNVDYCKNANYNKSIKIEGS